MRLQNLNLYTQSFLVKLFTTFCRKYTWCFSLTKLGRSKNKWGCLYNIFSSTIHHISYLMPLFKNQTHKSLKQVIDWRIRYKRFSQLILLYIFYCVFVCFIYRTWFIHQFHLCVIYFSFYFAPLLIGKYSLSISQSHSKYNRSNTLSFLLKPHVFKMKEYKILHNPA